MSSIYDTDFEQLAKENLPIKSRETTESPWQEVLTKPLTELKGDFESFRESVLFKLSHDSRKKSLEDALNVLYDPIEREITIDNKRPQQIKYFYEPGDQKPIYIYEPPIQDPWYIYEANGASLDDVNFIVLLPTRIRPVSPQEITNIETRINATVNYFKLASKNHALVWTS